jgi:hypothetical protein
VEVGDAIAGVGTDVENKARAALGQALGESHTAGDLEHLRQELSVPKGEGGGVDDVLARNYEHVSWCHGAQVAKGEHELGGEHLCRRGLTGRDGAEYAVGHGRERTGGPCATGGLKPSGPPAGAGRRPRSRAAGHGG